MSIYRLEKISRSKFSCSSTSTETDDDIEDCDDDLELMWYLFIVKTYIVFDCEI